MKVILSRKGFDSERGGYPSPILPDGRMISLPIPRNKDTIGYGDLKLNYKKYRTYYDLMIGLEINRPKWVVKKNNKKHVERFTLKKESKCHPDPDLDRFSQKRKKGWRPVFGQVGTAQSHLKNQKVKEGDIFLYFGTFRETIYENDGLQFDPNEDEKHVIFGYLQIGEIMNIGVKTHYYNWIENHPHTIPWRKRKKNNTVYLAGVALDFNNDIPGAGVFKYHKSLVLTKEGYNLSQWDLPGFFEKASISYHTDKEKCWKKDFFQSVGRGQEFVIQGDKEVEKWVKGLIKEIKILNNY